jgi:hypothetical protein
MSPTVIVANYILPRIIDFWTLAIDPFLIFFNLNFSETGLCLLPQVNSILSWAQSLEIGPISGL